MWGKYYSFERKEFKRSSSKFSNDISRSYASLNPMQMVGNIIAEPLLNYKKSLKQK